MLWVDQLKYIGLDRRERRTGVRLVERRREDFAGPAPSLRTALRQLRLRVLDVHEPAGRMVYIARATAVAILANAHRCGAVGDILIASVRKLGASTEPDPTPLLYAALDAADALLVEGT